MKHVVLRLVGASNEEATHLIKPVKTLLHLTGEEESWLKKTLEWRGSWGMTARPELKGKGLR